MYRCDITPGHAIFVRQYVAVKTTYPVAIVLANEASWEDLQAVLG